MTLPLISGLLETLGDELLLMPSSANSSDQNSDSTIVADDPVSEFRNEFQRMLIPAEEDTDSRLSAQSEAGSETERESLWPQETPQQFVPVLFVSSLGKPEGTVPANSESPSPIESSPQVNQNDGTFFPRQSTSITKPFLVTTPPPVPLTDRAFAIRLEQSQNKDFSADTYDQPDGSAIQKVEQKTDRPESLLQSGTTKKESSDAVTTTPEFEVKNTDQSAAEQQTLPSEIKTISVHSRPQSHHSQVSPEKPPTLPEMVSNPAVHKIESILESGRANPTQQIGIRIEGSELSQTASSTHPVDLYLEQRGKNLHVSVHTANASLAGEMKGSLQELSVRLHQQGYHAEFWSAPEVAPIQQTSKTDFSESHEQSQHKQEHSSNGQRNQDQQEKREEQQSHPRWLAEFEKRLFAPNQASKK